MSTDRAFDAVAEDYDAELNRGLSVSGEKKEFFAEQRIAWLKKQLDAIDFAPESILDFGCGTGSATPFLLEAFAEASLIGCDVSHRSIEVARREHGGPGASFLTSDDPLPAGTIDLAFTNGVFHHIPLDQRDAATQQVFNALRPGGVFAFWENNPLNPGTQIVMARCSFDHDAIKILAPAARKLLRKNGFEVISTTYRFIFPRMLAWLRSLEPALSCTPLGAQYMVLARKPENA